MNCAHCGASAIAGASSCYRCGRAFASAPPAAPLPRSPAVPRAAPAARRPRPTARSGGLTVAAWASFALAGLGLVDLVALRDSPLILAFVALQAIVGAALLFRWRGAWGTALALAIVDASLGVLVMLGGRLAGVLAGVCVATLAIVGVVGLAKGRAASKRRDPAPASWPS